VGAGVALLPTGCHPGINAARFLYAEIGREVERLEHDSVSRRATVPAMRKARLLASALTAPLNKSGVSLPPLEQCQFLVDAVVSKGAAASATDKQLAPQRPSTWGLEDRVGWLLELFERLEQHDRPAYGTNASAGETGNGVLN
jgi:phytoene synthase